MIFLKEIKVVTIMIYTSISIDFDFLNAMKPSILLKPHSLTSKIDPEGQILLKWCMLMLYGPKRYKKVIEVNL